MLANTLSLILAAAALTSANPPPADEECDVSYQDVTVTSVVTKVVEVQPTSSVYESPCPTSTVITSGDSTTTSYYTITSTLTSSYEITTTVDAPGDGPTDAPGDGPTDAPAPPSEYEPAPTSSKVAAPPYPVPGGNDTAPTGSSSVLLPTGTLTPPPPPGASCPAVWRTIGQEMMGAFAGCNRPARSSIRFAFHDAAGYSSKTTPYGPASGGADGSIMYSDEEVNRAGNEPLPDVAGIFRGVYANFEDQVTAADFVQFAGVIGVRMCGGPVYKTVVGREDDTTPCPEYMMPAAFGVNASYEALTELWADKGINERELAALIGAHSVSVAFAQAANGIPPNSSQDSTPAVMDMNYYKETQANVAPAGVHRFDSDINLANASTPIGEAFSEYSAVGGLDLWREEYAAAAYKLSIMGLGPAKEKELIDCTALIEELTGSA